MKDGMKRCFVISPIGDEISSDRFIADKILDELIIPACIENGYVIGNIIREEKEHTRQILKGIVEKLRDYELVIADLTNLNSNVFYEFGIRDALSKSVVCIAPAELIKDKKVPFDIQSTRLATYKFYHEKQDKKAKEVKDYLDKLLITRIKEDKEHGFNNSQKYIDEARQYIKDIQIVDIEKARSDISGKIKARDKDPDAPFVNELRNRIR